MSSSKPVVSDKKLSTVRDLGVPVHIERSLAGGAPVSGVVVGFGTASVVVHKFDDEIGFDGHVVVPRDDIARAKRRRDHEQFMLDLMEDNGWSAHVPEGIPTDDRWGLFEWILESSDGLTTLRTERHDPAEVSCGEVVALGKKRITFEPVSHDGQWLDTTQWQLKAITLVEFGSSAERALLRAAMDSPR